MPPGVNLAWLTCPRCLAVVPNPAIESVTASPAPAAPVVPETASPSPENPPAGERICPQCGKPIQARWLFCPHCEVALRSPMGGPVDAIVRRDTRRTGLGMALLAVVGGNGLVWGLVGSSGQAARGDFSAIAGVLVVFTILFGISALIALHRSRKDPSAIGVRRILVGTLTLAGGAIAISVIACFAVCVFVLAVCLSGARC
jgi:hypothetical protein